MKTEALHRINRMMINKESTPEPEALPGKNTDNLKSKRSTNVHFRADAKTLAKIETLAAKYGCSKTEIIITAIKKMK